METEYLSKSVEMVHTSTSYAQCSPRKKTLPAPSPGVLQLGRMHSDKAVEIEAVRILIPKSAISHVLPAKITKASKSLGHQREILTLSDGILDTKKEILELKSEIGKLKNSERRLLQDKEGLSNQLHVQTEVRGQWV